MSRFGSWQYDQDFHALRTVSTFRNVATFHDPLPDAPVLTFLCDDRGYRSMYIDWRHPVVGVLDTSLSPYASDPFDIYREVDANILLADYARRLHEFVTGVRLDARDCRHPRELAALCRRRASTTPDLSTSAARPGPARPPRCWTGAGRPGDGGGSHAAREDRGRAPRVATTCARGPPAPGHRRSWGRPASSGPSTRCSDGETARRRGSPSSCGRARPEVRATATPPPPLDRRGFPARPGPPLLHRRRLFSKADRPGTRLLIERCPPSPVARRSRPGCDYVPSGSVVCTVAAVGDHGGHRPLAVTAARTNAGLNGVDAMRGLRQRRDLGPGDRRYDAVLRATPDPRPETDAGRLSSNPATCCGPAASCRVTASAVDLRELSARSSTRYGHWPRPGRRIAGYRSSTQQRRGSR